MDSFRLGKAIRHEYRLKASKYSWRLLLGMASAVAGIRFGFVTLTTPDRVGSFEALALTMILAVCAIYMLASALRSRLVIDGTQIEIRGTFRKRSMDLSEIEGFRTISTGRNSVPVLCLKYGRNNNILLSRFAIDDDFRTWLQQLSDLDALDLSEIVAKPGGSGIFKFLVLTGAIFLFSSATMSVWVGYKLVEYFKARAAWNLTNHARNPDARNIAFLRHDGPVARPEELKGSGRIYLVQMGEHLTPYALDDFAQWLHTKYALDTQVLPEMDLDKSAWDPTRKQYVAELLYAQLKREHPDLAADSNAYLIGFTEADIYSVFHRWNSTFTQRDMQRTAIISVDGMQDDPGERAQVDPDTADRHFQARLRRILLKDVAVLYWRLALNNDPSSVLHQTLDPDVPSEDIYESDLDPARTQWGQNEGEPCIFFSYSSKDGIKPLAGNLIRTCADVDNSAHDESRELLELDLRLGVLIDKHTDFNLPDAIPIQFQRTIRDGWSGSNPFGISGSDNYDEFLSSADNIQISVVHADGGREELVRVPRWLPILQLVKYIDTDYSGKYYEMRWRSSPFEHYALKSFDGTVKTYLPCTTPKVLCYLTGYRNSQGQELKFERDSSRRLVRLTSPNQSWLRFHYEDGNRIAEIEDSRGRTVRYGYDENNRLISVAYPSGEAFHYEYDNMQHLLTVSIKPDAKAAPQLLLRNEYENSRLTKQTLADGGVYTYSYIPENADPIRTARVHTPDGRVFNLDIGAEDTIVREEEMQPKAAENQTAISNEPPIVSKRSQPNTAVRQMASAKPTRR